MRRVALELIAPRLDAEQVAQALRTLNTSTDVREQAWFLNELARPLNPADARRRQIEEWSIDAVTAMRSGKDLGLLASFVARLADGAQDAAAPRDGDDENNRLPSAGMLPADRVLMMLQAMDYNNCVDAIDALARATAGPLPTSVVNEALNLPVVNPVGKFSPRGWLISTLADRFPEESLAAVFHAAMELPHRINVGDSQAWGWSWTHEYPRGSALYSLTPQLRGEMAEAAFATAHQLPWMAREDLLKSLASHADELLARALFDYSFDIHATYMNLPDSAQIPYELEDTVLTEPLTTFKIYREVHFAEMIAATAAKLDPVRLDRAVAQAQAFDNEGPRSWLPSRLLPLLAEDRWEPLLSSAVVATMEFIEQDPSRLDLLTDLLPCMRKEIDRRKDIAHDFVENLFPGQRELLLSKEQFDRLTEMERRQYGDLMGIRQAMEMAALPEEADDGVRRQYLIPMVLSPVFADNMQDFLTLALSRAPLDARLKALENMKQILEPDSHTKVVDLTLHQVLQTEMEPMDRVRRVSALLPHIEPHAYDRLIDVAFGLPGPTIDDDETLCAELVDIALRDFGKPLHEDHRFGELRHNLAARIVERSISDREGEKIRRSRGPRVQLLQKVAPSLSEAGLRRAVDLMLELPAIERADGIAALLGNARGNLRRRLLRALFELESPFGRLWALFQSQATLSTVDDQGLASIARRTAESFSRPKNIAGCLLMLIGYAEDERESWIKQAVALSEMLPADDRLRVLTLVARLAENDPDLTRLVMNNIRTLPTPDLVHTGLLMAARLKLDMSSLTAADFGQLQLAASRRLRFAAQRGRTELLKVLASESPAFTAMSTADVIYEIACAMHDICVKWRWPSSS